MESFGDGRRGTRPRIGAGTTLMPFLRRHDRDLRQVPPGTNPAEHPPLLRHRFKPVDRLPDGLRRAQHEIPPGKERKVEEGDHLGLQL